MTDTTDVTNVDDKSKTITKTEAITQGLALVQDAKAGYKTSEFWLKVVALALTVCFATGVIPTTGVAAQVAEIAAVILGALGYTVCRSWVKAS